MEKSQSAFLQGFFVRHLFPFYLQIAPDRVIYPFFCFFNLVGGQFSPESEVKTRALHRNVRAVLPHFRPQHRAKRRVQKMRRGMQARDALHL